MNDLKAPIDTLKDKIEQLIASHGQLAESLSVAKNENAELAQKLEEKETAQGDTAALLERNAMLVKQLEEKDILLAEKENNLKESELLLKELGEKNKLHNLAQSISGNNGSEQNEELKLIITDLVKEIDKCITLLGKNV
jgi:hypothetical protein